MLHQTNNNTTLPNEILAIIFANLRPAMLLNLARVCKSWQALVYDNYFWKEKTLRHFPSERWPVQQNWKEAYRTFHHTHYAGLRSNRFFSLAKEEAAADLANFLTDSTELDIKDNAGFSVLSWVRDKKNPLVFAAVFEKLVQLYGTNKKDTFNRTLLHWAILLNQPLTRLESLIKSGIKVKSGSKFGTPLFIAAETGQTEVVAFLIQHGASVNQKPNALYVAAENGHDRVMEVLLKNGAKVNHKRANSGRSVLYVACEKGHSKVVDVLLRYRALVQIGVEQRMAPLNIAARHGHTEIVRKLIQQNANLNTLDKEGQTPFRQALENNHEETALVLVEAGADVNLGNNQRKTALLFAVYHGMEHVFKALILKRVDVNAMAQGNVTPLHQAVKQRDSAMVTALLAAGAAVNVQTGDGNTALHLSLSTPIDIELVELLLENEADVSLANANGITPLKLAEVSGEKEVVKLLNEKRLLNYERLNALRPQDDYRRSFCLFGVKINFGCSAGEKRLAAEALDKVVFEGADRALLEPHRKALENGELREISRALLRA